jgi:arginase
MGPDAFRAAGLAEMIAEMGFGVTDIGNVAPAMRRAGLSEDQHLYALPETVAWADSLTAAAEAACAQGFPIFLGGDHAMSIGTVAGVARHAVAADRELFVLWLDAHTDLHTPQSTSSGHLHGTSLGYIAGSPGFDAFLPMPRPVPPENIGLFGLRSVDAPERECLATKPMLAVDMRMIDEVGIARPLSSFLDKVAARNGLLHVSFDVDFLDPSIAPAVGTTVPGGATYREAHLVMEMLCDSGLVTSLDLVELNPILDERGRTVSLMVDLTASLLGRRVFDRPTRSF